MSPDEYMKSITPQIRGSALSPLTADLRYLRDKGCSMRQLTMYACTQGVHVHLATVARFMAALDAQASPEGSALPSPKAGHPVDETAPALPAVGPSASFANTEVLQPNPPKPFAFRETEGEIARSVMVRLRSKDSSRSA